MENNTILYSYMFNKGDMKMGTKKSTEQIYELKYTGSLAESSNVFLHYGYSEWSDVSECKMRKLKSCYKTEITLPAGAELNFCFRNEEGAWDNNCGNNYYFTPGVVSDYCCVEICDKPTKAITTKKTTSSTKTTTAKAKTSTKKVK